MNDDTKNPEDTQEDIQDTQDRDATPEEDVNDPDASAEDMDLGEFESPEPFSEPTTPEPAGDQELAAIYDIPVEVSAVLGKTTMEVNQLLKMGRGAVVELDRKIGEPIDIFVNNRLVARGEVVVVEEHLGITMTEIIRSDKPGP